MGDTSAEDGKQSVQNQLPQPASAAAADAAAGGASPSQAADAAAGGASPSQAARDLAEIRKRHQEKFLQREAENEKLEQEERQEQEQQEVLKNQQQEQDEALARQLAKEEEENRLHQLEADEEYSRQLAEQMSGGAPSGASVPMQSFSASGHRDVPLDDSDTDAQYHQMEDDEGYRPAMRTGYTDRLIDPPQAGRYGQFPPLLGVEFDALLDQVRMQSNRRNGATQWKTALVWAVFALVMVVFTCWLLLAIQDIGGDMDGAAAAGKDVGAVVAAAANNSSAAAANESAAAAANQGAAETISAAFFS